MVDKNVNQVVDHLFRHEYGSLVAGLTARFGGSKIELIEDAVQEALFKAMKVWPYKKVPEKPGSWLYRVAYNALIDSLRKEERHHQVEVEDAETIEEGFTVRDANIIQDQQLQMIFACCHPAFTEKNSLLLSLKLIGGFSVKEISRSLLMKEEAGKKSVQRARSDFQEKVRGLVLPEGRELHSFLDRVLKVLYLIFNEGYKASDGDELIKEDLCGEALRLALLLAQKPHCQTSELYALISLIGFKAARFKARTDQAGNLVLMEEQNRSEYDQEYVKWGYYYYSQATRYREMSRLYLEASIEFEYHIATDFTAINWQRVLTFHDKLCEKWPSPKARLNYLIVYSRVQGPAEALTELLKLQGALADDHLYHTFKADLLTKLGQKPDARQALESALALVTNQVERTYLLRKLKGLH